MNKNEIREKLLTLKTNDADFSVMLVNLIIALVDLIPVVDTVSETPPVPVVLCRTRINYKVSPNTPGDGYVVYQNVDGYMYVYFPKVDNFSAYVCPVLWEGEPRRYEKRIGGYSYFQSQHFHLKEVSLGEKLEIENFRLTSLALDAYLEIQQNPAAAIAKLKVLQSVDTEKLGDAVKFLEMLDKRVDGFGKDLSKTENDIRRVGKYLRRMWDLFSDFSGDVKAVFNRKKWTKRFEKRADNFFTEHRETDVFDDDDIPF